MELLLLFARVLLAVVFGVAGLAKFFDRSGSRQALIDFGIPVALASPLGLLLPVTELAVAVALVPLSTAWGGALGALVLLLLFLVMISVTLARGRAPACHCFGQLSSKPVGWPTLVRNGLLTAVAGVVVWHDPHAVGPSMVDWLGELTSSQLMGLGAGGVGVGLLAAQGWALLHLLRQHGRILLRLDALEGRLGPSAPTTMRAGGMAPHTAGLPVGATAPAFRLSNLHGETLTLDALRAAGPPVLLLFIDPNCGPCHALLPDLAQWQRVHAARLTLALISRGGVEANRAKSLDQGLMPVLLQQDQEISQAYRVSGTPSAVVVLADGRIGSPLAEGVEAIRALVAQTLERVNGHPSNLALLPPVVHSNGRCPHCGRDHAHDAAPAVHMTSMANMGEPAPPFTLPDLTGKPVTLTDYRGRTTLILFWNPDCGFCQQLLPELKVWEASPRAGAPTLLVVSTGTAEANAAMGFRAHVVLDDRFSTGVAFGIRGTTSAIRVGADGTIASPVAAGAQAVLALAYASSPREP